MFLKAMKWDSANLIFVYLFHRKSRCWYLKMITLNTTHKPSCILNTLFLLMLNLKYFLRKTQFRILTSRDPKKTHTLSPQHIKYISAKYTWHEENDTHVEMAISIGKTNIPAHTDWKKNQLKIIMYIWVSSKNCTNN